MGSRNAYAWLAVFLLLIAASPAFALEDEPEQENRSQSSPINNPAGLEVRLSQYEEELRKINGKLEELQYQNRQLQQKLDKAGADNDFRLKAIENKVGLGAMAQSPALESSNPIEEKKPGIPASNPGSAAGKEKILGTIKADKNQKVPATEGVAESPTPANSQPKTPEQKTKEEYETAFDLLRQSKYDESISAFEKFAGDNPTNPLTSGAYYWMGEAYFVQKDYENAAKKFVAGYKKFPKGGKAPETLLKLGDSLAALSKKKEACITYDKLANEFPKAGSAVKKKLAESRQKLNCQ